jgi:hypothetical protein
MRREFIVSPHSGRKERVAARGDHERVTLRSLYDREPGARDRSAPSAGLETARRVWI